MSYEVCLEKYEKDPDDFYPWLVNKVREEKKSAIKFLEESIVDKKLSIERLKRDLNETVN